MKKENEIGIVKKSEIKREDKFYLKSNLEP